MSVRVSNRMCAASLPLSLSISFSTPSLVYAAVNLLCWPQTSCPVSNFSCNVIIFYIILILIFNLWLQSCHARHGQHCVCVYVLVWVDCCQPRWSTHAHTHTQPESNSIKFNLRLQCESALRERSPTYPSKNNDSWGVEWMSGWWP